MRHTKHDRYTPFNAIPNPKSYLPQRTQDVLARQRVKRAHAKRRKHVAMWVAIIAVAAAVVVWAVKLWNA